MKKHRLQCKGALVALELAFCLVALVIWLSPAAALSQGFTIQQILSAPFAEGLTPAPAGGRMAWVTALEGRRNIWVAEPDASGKGYTSRQLTHYSEDDGQELHDISWTPDGASILYVRGDDVQGPMHPVPNPAWFPQGAKEQIWEIGVAGGEPRLIADGSSLDISPNGKTLAYLAMGQVWTISLDTPNAKPAPLLQMRGGTSDLRWSPDSSKLAFVSSRIDHSFVVVYTLADKSLNYLDPSTNLDNQLVWSPDSKRIAYVRTPPVSNPVEYMFHRAGLPWSIRIADAATGQGHEIWRAAAGVGSVFQPTASANQLHWVAGDRLVFPWERDGWLHFYSVPVAGGTASLLTPGDFEVEHVTLGADRKTLVFDSNQGDIDRRHVWKLTFAADDSTGPPQALTSGIGIETQPVLLSDNATVAVLRSDAHLPMRAAVLEDGRLVDLAPHTIPADFPGPRFVEPQQVIFSATDGLQIHGQLFLPPNEKPGERHPAMIFFHGGSRRQMLLGFHYGDYYSGAYAMNQYLASKGYVVLSVNYRSGTGYGLNFREALNYGFLGASEFNDVMGAGLYLKNRNDVDGKHIGTWGGSYGGYLTALALARASDLFAAGVDLHGVYDWNGLFQELSPGSGSNEHSDSGQLAFLSSPSASIATWHSPVLIIQGDDDRNVPFTESVHLAAALRAHGVDYEELIFPDEIHGFLLYRTWIRTYTGMADFLDRKLANKQQ